MGPKMKSTVWGKTVQVPGVGSDTGISFHSKDSPLNGGSKVDIAVLTTAALGGLPCSLWISRSVTPFPEEFNEARQGLGHGHGYLFDEAGQVYVPFRQACTLMGAQGDVDLVVHVKPFRMVVQLLSLQGHPCHEAKGPVEVFEMELLEDGISAFHLVPPHGPQVWQQLVPLLSTEPVCFASLGERNICVGDKHRSVAFLYAPGRGVNPKPRYVP